MNKLPQPIDGAIYYENEHLYVCLANFPITKGHSVVVWKKNTPDIHLLERHEYEHLMDTVDQARNAMLKTLGIDKVYMMYMDEVKQVHWHLIPRYKQAGFNILSHNPKPLKKTALASQLKNNWSELV